MFCYYMRFWVFSSYAMRLLYARIKKCLFSALCFVLVFTILSSIFIVPFNRSEIYHYQDAHLRESVAGTVDCIVLGASHALKGFVPAILDRDLGCFSYNLSGSLMTLNGKKYLLEKELIRNPVNTVILEVSYDTLQRDESMEYAHGDELLMTRLGSFGERVKYMVNNLHFDDWMNVYAAQMQNGFIYLEKILSGKNLKAVDYSLKGFEPMESENVTTNRKISVEADESTQPEFRCSNIKEFIELIDLCKEYNARPIVVVTPVSDAFISQNLYLDEFYELCKSICEENDCEFYDFNLIKSRNLEFSDETSFSDETHLSEEGAICLSTIFTELMRDADKGKTVFQLFL